MGKKDKLCELCTRYPKFKNTSACRRCFSDLRKEQAGSKPKSAKADAEKYPCSFCGDPAMENKSVCKKCNKLSYGTPTYQRTKIWQVSDFKKGSAEYAVLQALKKLNTKNRYASLSAIVKATFLDKDVVKKILDEKMIEMVMVSRNSYRLKSKYLDESLNLTVAAILSGADILTQLEMM